MIEILHTFQNVNRVKSKAMGWEVVGHRTEELGRPGVECSNRLVLSETKLATPAAERGRGGQGEGGLRSRI